MAERGVVRVAAVNDYELVVAGLAHLLAAFPDELEVRDRIVLGEPIHGPVDVALYDTYGRIGIAEKALRQLVNDEAINAVAVFTMVLDDRLVQAGRAAGARGFISKSLPARAIVDAIVAIADGEEVVAEPEGARDPSNLLDWPGRADGLSERESQVLALTAQGLTNREIAAGLYLSVETVKSYLRQVYVKLGFRNRVDAAAYVLRTGSGGRSGTSTHSNH